MKRRLQHRKPHYEPRHTRWIVALLASLSSVLCCAEEAPTLTGQFVLKAPIGAFEHQVPDCSLIHFHLPKPPPEGQMFQLQMLSSQSAASGSRIMVAGFVAENDEAEGTFAYRDAQDRQWLPGGEDLSEQQALTLTLDGKPFNEWVATADRTQSEYLVDLSFSTTTPLVIFTNTGMQPVGEVTASYQGQCTVSIPWLPEGMNLQ
jgi:hypothetical protein